MEYLICFFVSTLLAYQAKISKNKTNMIFWSLMSILVTALLAGLRDISIGIDTSNYFYGSWDRAFTTDLSLGNYLRYYLTISRGRSELVFALLEYLVAKLTGSYNVLLFLVHFSIISCIYIGAFRLKDHCEPELVLLLFYLVYYNHSLNIYRQYLAMAIVFAALRDIEIGKHFRYLCFVFVGTLCHNTCLLAVLPLLIYRTLYPENKAKKTQKKTSTKRKVMTLLVILVIIYSFIPTARLLIARGFLSRKYLYYLNDEYESLPLMALLFIATELSAIAVFWKSYRKRNIRAEFYISCSVAFFLMYLLASRIVYGKRIAAYFSFANLISIAMIVNCQPNRKQKLLVRFLVLAIVFVYWVYVFVYRNASSTLPYRSILNLF